MVEVPARAMFKRIYGCIPFLPVSNVFAMRDSRENSSVSGDDMPDADWRK